MLGADLLLWMPWALLGSAVALVVGVRAYRRGDRTGALGWVGWALVPPALLLTGTLRLVGRVSGAVLDWSASLAFNPTTWTGVALGAVAAVLLGTARALRGRQRRSGVSASRPGAALTSKASGRRPAAGVEDELTEVEEILRRRGIS